LLSVEDSQFSVLIYSLRTIS